ncbi:MAG TPA: DNA cytosine methyltransferase [Ktedonobacteraceae bacterium]|nr:DNA cytosine methyltransferase [Ktedonobacteraceae bacterium]
MQLDPQQKRSAHFFAGCGGDIWGMMRAGWLATLAIEINKWRCQTLRANYAHHGLQVIEGPIQALTLGRYPALPLLCYFMTFPCDHYTLAANVHDKWSGDALYLEALREIVLRFPEMVVIENVLGMRKFKRVMETFRALPFYHCTEFTLFGEDFTHQRKSRVFLILTRQAYDFPPLESYRLSRPGTCLGDYLDMEAPLPDIPPYIYTRLEGKTYRDRPRIYDPAQTEPVNLFTNYGRDRSLFLVRDERAPRKVRPFTVREVGNLHGFPPDYQFIGPLGERYDMAVDSVMPFMARAIGLALDDYLAFIPQLAEPPQSLGYREVLSPRQKRQQMEEAMAILQEPAQPDWEESSKHALQLQLW